MNGKSLLPIVILLSLLIPIPGVLSSTSILMEDEPNTWISSSTGLTITASTVEEIYGSSDLKFVTSSSTAIGYHNYAGADWSSWDGLSLWTSGTNGKTVTYEIWAPDTSNKWTFTVAMTGSWAFKELKFSDMTVTGSPNKANIQRFYVNLNSQHSCTMYLDHLFLWSYNTYESAFPGSIPSNYNASGVYVTHSGSVTSYSPSSTALQDLPLTLTWNFQDDDVGNVATGLFSMYKYNSSYQNYPYQYLMVNFTIWDNQTIVFDEDRIRIALATAYLDPSGDEYYLEYELWDSPMTLYEGENSTYLYADPVGDPPTVEVFFQNSSLGTNYVLGIPIQEYAETVYPVNLTLNSVYFVCEKDNTVANWTGSLTVYGMWLYSDYPEPSSSAYDLRYVLVAGAILVVCMIVLVKFVDW